MKTDFIIKSTSNLLFPYSPMENIKTISGFLNSTNLFNDFESILPISRLK